MDKLKEKLNTLRTEADQALERANTAENDYKRVEGQLEQKGAT